MQCGCVGWGGAVQCGRCKGVEWGGRCMGVEWGRCEGVLRVGCEGVEWGVRCEGVVMDHSHWIQGCARKIADAVSSYIGAVAGVAIFIALALVSQPHPLT